MILASVLSAAIACAGLTGCATSDRTAGTRIDDHMTAHRVRSALANAPVYKFPNVQVDVYDGIVQLSGFAETKDQKQYAGEISSHVEGVRKLINDIAVEPRYLTAPTGYTYGHQYPAPPTAGNPQPNNDNNNVNNGLNGANRQAPPANQQ